MRSTINGPPSPATNVLPIPMSATVSGVTAPSSDGRCHPHATEDSTEARPAVAPDSRGRRYVGRMRPDVELRLPVDSAYVSVLRATTVSLAARLDFTIDDIEDLRMAVGEASAIVLPMADEGSDMTCRYFMSKGRLTISVTVPSHASDVQQPEGFA